MENSVVKSLNVRIGSAPFGHSTLRDKPPSGGHLYFDEIKMRSPTLVMALITTSLVCSACSFAPAVSMKESQTHYRAAHNFEAQGDFVSARDQYWKALVTARSGGASPEVLSMLTYESGRTSGYTCQLEKSESLLLESLKMEESLSPRNSRNIGIRLFELARLTYDQRRYKESAVYYSGALREVESNNGEWTDPIAFAEIYEEYADALTQNGDQASAQVAVRKARNLREASHGQPAKFKPVRYKCPRL